LAGERDPRCGLTARFFADFDIEILHSVRGWRRTTEAPSRRSSQRGRISKRFRRLRIDDSTAPFAAEVQSLLAKTLRGESLVDGAVSARTPGIWKTPIIRITDIGRNSDTVHAVTRTYRSIRPDLSGVPSDATYEASKCG
jgi:hypothetical protein